jgi:hypothetical protein
VRIVDLPPEGYRCPNEYVFGPWHEVWTSTEPQPFVKPRPGWVVQIGEGAIWTERPFLELNSSSMVTLPTEGRTRLAFRARKNQFNVHDRIYDELTVEEARRRHPDCEVVQVRGTTDPNGIERDAILVWRTSLFPEGLDEEERRPRAVYWLRR